MPSSGCHALDKRTAPSPLGGAVNIWRCAASDRRAVRGQGRGERLPGGGAAWAVGTWRALVHTGGERSFGYYRSVEDAARAVDYGRWTLGLPPVNFPDSFDETLARRDHWMTRTSRGPRGLAAKVVETLRDRELTVADVFDGGRGDVHDPRGVEEDSGEAGPPGPHHAGPPRRLPRRRRGQIMRRRCAPGRSVQSTTASPSPRSGSTRLNASTTKDPGAASTTSNSPPSTGCVVVQRDPLSTRPSATSTVEYETPTTVRSTPTSRRWRENPPATEPGRFTRFGAAPSRTSTRPGRST